MKLEAIYEEWKKDSDIDKTELGDESIKIPKLHHKYFQVYSSEKMLLKKYEAEMRQLKLAKYEFYTQGPTKETQDLDRLNEKTPIKAVFYYVFFNGNICYSIGF